MCASLFPFSPAFAYIASGMVVENFPLARFEHDVSNKLTDWERRAFLLRHKIMHISPVSPNVMSNTTLAYCPPSLTITGLAGMEEC
jgi:hypothetical protein